MLRKNKTHDFVANKFFEIENFRIFFCNEIDNGFGERGSRPHEIMSHSWVGGGRGNGLRKGGVGLGGAGVRGDDI